MWRGNEQKPLNVDNRMQSKDQNLFTDSHAKEILTTMNTLRKTGSLCDVTLTICNQQFPAHRIVLAACSDYFLAMFTNEMTEKDKSTIELGGIGPSVMEVLLDFVYTETVNVNVDNVQELLPAACLLQLTGVKEACSEFLEKQLDPSNCLGIQQFAESHGCRSLCEAALNFAYKHFQEVISEDEFIALPIDSLEKLISCNEIRVESEEIVYHGLIKWIHAPSNSNRLQYMPRLLSHIRLCLLSPVFLTDVLDEEPTIKADLCCRDLLDEAKKYHLRPDLRDEMKVKRSEPRTGYEDVLVVLGGFGVQENPVDSVEKYDPKTSTWTRLPNISKCRRYVTATSVQTKVYMIGGHDGLTRLSTVECLDLSDPNPTWVQVASMTYQRGLAGVCMYQGKIYVAGGYDGHERHTSMECYNPDQDRWSLMGKLSIGREGAGLVSAGKFIYCIGGYDGIELLNSGEKYNSETNTWSMIEPMHTKRSGAGCAVMNDTIYVCGGYDGNDHLATVECYNMRSHQWMIISNMMEPRCYVGACLLKGKLCVVAGYDGSVLLNSVECYDAVMDRWEKLEQKMTNSRCDAGVTVVRQR